MFSRDQVRRAKQRAFSYCDRRYSGDASRYNACISGAATVEYTLTGDWEIEFRPEMGGRGASGLVSPRASIRRRNR